MVESERNMSASLIRGILARFDANGYKTGGFKAYTVSDVPKGSGLSSSAAFESLIGMILNCEFNDGAVDAIEIAKAGQFAEIEFFGKPCGLMDQTASAVGSVVQIDFKDPNSPSVKRISLDLARFGHTLCVVETGGDHADLTDDYSGITSEMRGIASAFGKTVLSEVDASEFYGSLAKLRTGHSDRAILRAIHYFEENQRVIKQAKSLQSGDFNEFLRLVRESGLSSYCYLQNVFSTKHVDKQGISLALALAEKILGQAGAFRVHGGGFAGTILAFVPDGLMPEFERAMSGAFGAGACKPLYLRPCGVHRIV
jgi:galactokinase